MIQEAPARLELNQKVDIAILLGFPASHRAKKPDIPRAVLGRNAQNLLPLFLQEAVKCHTPTPSGSSRSSRPTAELRSAARAVRPSGAASFRRTGRDLLSVLGRPHAARRST